LVPPTCFVTVAQLWHRQLMSHVWKSPPGRPFLGRHGLSSLRWMSPYRILITFFNIRKNGHCLYNGPAARWRMEHSGTVVHLRDIFYNVCLPVTPALRGISNVAAVTDSTQLSFSTVKDHGDDLPRHRDLSISISWSVVHR